MKTPWALLLVAASTTLLCAAAPAQASEPPRHHTARLTCGRSTLTAETRWRVSPSQPLVWLEQKLRLQRAEAPKAQELPLEGRWRKRVAAGHSGLDAVVVSWACLQSHSGASYILLAYGCGSDDADAFCGGEKEWFRLLDEQGRRLDAGLARQDGRYEPLYEKLGVARLMSEGVSMRSLLSDD